MSDAAESERRYRQLEAVVRARPGRWLVLTHDNPDPDALASAVLLAGLLREAFGRDATAAFGGLIGRAENREMVRSLKLRVSDVHHLSLARFHRFALVDTQPGTGNNALPKGTVPDLVFDHHPLRRGTRSAGFVDVRPAFGATVTILSGYLAAAGVAVSVAEATAVVYAIRSETQDFGREYTLEDRATYDAFLARVNKRALGRIQKASLPVSYFRCLHQALENVQTVGTLVVSHLEEVEQPDIVPEVADLLLRMEGKSWALCTGRFEGRIYLSMRTSNPRGEAGRLMRVLVGKNGRGGGHGMTAGGWVPLTGAGAAEPRAVQEQLGRTLASHLRKDPARLGPLSLDPSAGCV